LITSSHLPTWPPRMPTNSASPKLIGYERWSPNS
jgi:hypothetical protein